MPVALRKTSFSFIYNVDVKINVLTVAQMIFPIHIGVHEQRFLFEPVVVSTKYAYLNDKLL